ncbi:MAG: LysR substrate-binding domain-containing protein [Methylobacterium frigidaeris]
MFADRDGEPGSPIGPERLPPLGALRCFEAAARLESFTRAAAELHLTHGAVSRAVRAIEDEVGVALFERRSRRVFLTEAGAALHRAVAEAFGTIGAATRMLRARARHRPLVLSCEPTLLMRWLIPRVGDLAAAHPDVALQFVSGCGTVRFDQGLDFAIRRNDHPVTPGTHEAVLFEERVGPVCAPSRIDEFFASGEDPAFRAGTPCLHTRSRPGAWDDWAARSGCPAPDGPAHAFEHFYLSLQAAAAGLGVAIGPERLVCDDVASGLLAAPLGFVADGSDYRLLAPRPIAPDSAEAHLRDWLRAC